MSGLADTKSRDREYIVPTYKRYDVNIVRGAGALLYDETGKE